MSTKAAIWLFLFLSAGIALSVALYARHLQPQIKVASCPQKDVEAGVAKLRAKEIPFGADCDTSTDCDFYVYDKDVAAAKGELKLLPNMKIY